MDSMYGCLIKIKNIYYDKRIVCEKNITQKSSIPR